MKSGELRETLITTTEESVTEQALRETSLRLAPKGALLVAMYGATVGRVARLGITATTNQAVCHIVPDPKRADEQYLFHALKAKAPELIGRGVGGAQPNISQGTIKDTAIFLPPVPEQRRIAAILDQADALRRLRRQSLSRLSDLGQAKFDEAFGKVQGTVPLEDAVKDTLIGLVRDAEEFGNEFAYPYVRMDAITRNGQFVPALVQKTDADRLELERYALVDGDLLFNTRNSRDLVGKTAIFRGMPGAVFNNNIMRIRFNQKWDPVFVEAYFRSRAGARELEKRKSGTTSVWAVYWSKLKSFPLPEVEYETQLEFRRFIEATWIQEESLKVEQSKYESLFASLQHRAFRGEL
ncbi:hypothetical protein ATE59_15455 [Sphingopyxis sp. A083]|nr:hypothetical protein ATE59_15455 [Sphingopyxis sp. A083]